MMKKYFIKNKGITLIALVVTIIVLLILAGISIATLTGDNGILKRATESKEKNLKAIKIEKIDMLLVEYSIDKNTKGISFVDWIKSKYHQLSGTIDDIKYEILDGRNGEQIVSFTISDDLKRTFDNNGNEIKTKYSINYELNGGRNSSNVVTYYEVGSSQDLPVPTKINAEFLGWSINNDTEYNKENIKKSITASDTGDITLYAMWLNATSSELFDFTKDESTKTATLLGFTADAINDGRASKITELIIPSYYIDQNNEQYKITTIGSNAFSNNTNITRLILHNMIDNILNGAFVNCTSIKYLKIPITFKCTKGMFDGVFNIEEVYFSKGTEDKNGIGATYIYDDRYNTTCTSLPWIISKDKLTKVTIERGVTKIGDYMFYNCYNISNTWNDLINNREELTSIGISSFYGCVNIAGELILPNEVSVNNSAFQGCTGILKLTVPDDIKMIGLNSFTNCTSIKYLKIPITFKCTRGMFDGVFNIEEVYFSKGTEDKNGIGATYIYDDRYNTTCNGLPWIISKDKLTKVTIERGVTKIGDYMFYNCYNISNTWNDLINNREELTSIGISSFYGCVNIAGELILPNEVSVNNSAFQGCTGILKLTVPDDIKMIGSNSFANCTSIKYLKIPITNAIFRGMFTGVSNIEELYLSKGNKESNGVGINYYNDDRYNMTCNGLPWIISKDKLTKVTIEKGITSIGDWMFYNCSKINQLVYTGNETEWSTVVIRSNNNWILKNKNSNLNIIYGN